jgi:thioredoxin 1
MLVKTFPALLFILLLSACSENSQSAQKTPQEQDVVSTAPVQLKQEGHTLVFFLDPNGAPCQMQDAILRGMSEELQGIVDLRYLQTTVPADLDHFYKFGVRGLPTLLVADASGKELRRLPPGVKAAEEIRALLLSVSGR